MAFIPTPNYRWEKGLATALATILARPPKDAKVFRRTLAHSLAFGGKIRQERGPTTSTVGATASHPIASALISHHGKEISSLQRTLLWLLLELHLKQEVRWAVEVSQWLRGLAKGSSHGLAMSLGECEGLRELVAKAESLAEEVRPRREITSHGPFNEAWNGDFRNVLLGLLAAVPGADEHSGGGQPLSGPHAAPITLSAGTQDEPDDDPLEIWEPVQGHIEETTEESRRAKALSRELSGHGVIELVRGMDSILPDAIGRKWWTRATRGTESTLDTGDLEAAERHLGCVLAIEAGLKASELGLVVFANRAEEGYLALDLDAGLLRRPEARPPFAFAPKADEKGLWAEVGGDIPFPLSSVLRELADRLLRARSAAGSLSRVLLDRTPNPSHALSHSMKELWPGRSLPSSSFRRRLVAGLAAQLGPDAAQIAFGETFGASAAPTYYAGHSAHALMACVERLNAPILGGATESPSRPGFEDYLLGSRVRPARLPFAEAWEKLGVSAVRGRGRPSTKTLIERLRAERDSLAVHFLLCTGQRPNENLARFQLADLLPVDGMALIQDKQSDPARLTRLVATGRRFIGAVESYVASLRRLSGTTDSGEVRKAVLGILTSDKPLFHSISLDGSVEPLAVGSLTARLPEPWASRPNLSRHALNLALTQSGVDPELRYFQMGWVATDAHAVSDIAPYPPRQLGPRLAPTIDDWLQAIGWQGGCEPGNPEELHRWQPMRDYTEERNLHHQAHASRVQQLRSDLEHRRDEALPEVATLLAASMPKELRGFRLELHAEGKSLRLTKSEADQRPVVSEVLVDAWLAPFEHKEPIQGHLAAWLLTGALKRAAKSAVLKVEYLPRLSRLGPTAQPSPFMPRVGLAVTHAIQIRAAIARLAMGLGNAPEKERESMLAGLLVLAIAAHTRHRSLDHALGFAQGLLGASCSEQRTWLLRLPYGRGHDVAAGAVPILWSRLQAMPGSRRALENLIEEKAVPLGELLVNHVPELCRDLPSQDAVTRVFKTLEFAGSAELDGPARLLAAGAVIPATVTVNRAVSADSGKTVGGGESDSEGEGPLSDREDEASQVVRTKRGRGRPRPALRKHLENLMPLFNPDHAGLIGDNVPLPDRHRKSQLQPLMESLLDTLDTSPTSVRLVLEFVYHLLTVRRTRERTGLLPSVIYGKYNRLTRVIDALPPLQDLSEVSGEGITGALIVALQSSESHARPRLMAEAKAFLKFAEERHGIAQADWPRVRALAKGERYVGQDPAIVLDAEVGRMLGALETNLSMDALAKVGAVERRMRELQLGVALILEASGARPQSIYGLTVGDIYHGDTLDHIHLKTRGPFASVKTRTSAGFVQLEGAQWQQHRNWFKGWVERMAAGQDSAILDKVPLFQLPGAPLGTRYPLQKVTARISELVRWATQQPRGRTYWLRKRRIQIRHDRLRGLADPTARVVGQTLRACGHVLINTPLASYLGDPATYGCGLLHPQGAPSRKEMAQLSGLSLNTLDQRWHRLGRKVDSGADRWGRTQVAVRLIPEQSAATNFPPPPSYQPYNESLTWMQVARVMEALHDADGRGVEDEQVSDGTGVGIELVEGVRRATEELLVRLKISPLQRTEQLQAPRQTQFGKSLLPFVTSHDSRLSPIAEEWVSCALLGARVQCCKLIRQEAINKLVELLKEAGIEADPSRGNDGVTQVLPKERHAYGLWPALRWALIVAWVAERQEQVRGG